MSRSGHDISGECALLDGDLLLFGCQRSHQGDCQVFFLIQEFRPCVGSHQGHCRSGTQKGGCRREHLVTIEQELDANMVSFDTPTPEAIRAWLTEDGKGVESRIS